MDAVRCSPLFFVFSRAFYGPLLRVPQPWRRHTSESFEGRRTLLFPGADLPTKRRSDEDDGVCIDWAEARAERA